jgi:hypothetical protein
VGKEAEEKIKKKKELKKKKNNYLRVENQTINLRGIIIS